MVALVGLLKSMVVKPWATSRRADQAGCVEAGGRWQAGAWVRRGVAGQGGAVGEVGERGTPVPVPACGTMSDMGGTPHRKAEGTLWTPRTKAACSEPWFAWLLLNAAFHP